MSTDNAPRSGYAPPTALTEARNISSSAEITMDENVMVSPCAKPEAVNSSLHSAGMGLELDTTNSAAKKLADSREEQCAEQHP